MKFFSIRTRIDNQIKLSVSLSLIYIFLIYIDHSFCVRYMTLKNTVSATSKVSLGPVWCCPTVTEQTVF